MSGANVYGLSGDDANYPDDTEQSVRFYHVSPIRARAGGEYAVRTMLALFLSLIDRLIKVVELRQTDRRQLFKEVAEPLFNQLQPVVDDYFGLFHRARQLVLKSRDGEALNQAVEEIRMQREKMVQARRSVVQFAETINTRVQEERMVHFADTVEQFFFSTKVPGKTSRNPKFKTSRPAQLVELFEYVASDRLNKSTLVVYIDETLRCLESTWIAVAQSYASLRVYCMSPERYYVKSNGDE